MIDIEQIEQHMANVAKRVDAFDWSDTLSGDVKAEVLQGVRDNFTSSVNPDGKKWKPRKNKGDGHPLLIDTGKLLQAAVGSGAGRVQQADAAELTVGVDTARVPYAAVHNRGGKKMPQREFMGVQNKRLKRIDKLIANAGMEAFD